MMATMTEVTKGSTLRGTIAYLRSQGGETLVDDVLSRLAPERRAEIEGAGSGSEVPFEWMSSLLTAADAVLGATKPDWCEEAGSFSITSSGKELYPRILSKATPIEFLTQQVSLFRLYYAPGDMIVVDQDEHRVVLRLVGFDHGNRLFCRRQVGGLQAAVELAGGRSARARHIRCAEDGDAFCEWEITWSAPQIALVG